MAAEIGRPPVRKTGERRYCCERATPQLRWQFGASCFRAGRPKRNSICKQTFSHRQAAVAAARLNQWGEAADWLRSARALADHVNQATYCAGLLIDEGYARWKGGDNRAALQCLVEGLANIDRLPPDDADEGAYLLRKRAGHTILWCEHHRRRAAKSFARRRQPAAAAWSR
jgi:hypothetical protein